MFGSLLGVIVLACAAAPLWARYVAHTTPAANHLTDTVEIDGQDVDVVALDGTPIGPTWQGRFFLGADENGRDVMVRLLYGGRNSLAIGFGAALLTLLIAVFLGLVAGMRGGWVDALISRGFDVLWAFPALLLAVALGAALAQDGIKVGPFPAIEGGSLLIPIGVIAIVFVPYLARPLRGQALALRHEPFFEAAIGQGASRWQLIRGEILPNVRHTIVAMAPLLVANAILLEAALSFLGAGVQEPEPSWGTMIATGVERISSAPYLAIIPGALLAVTLLSLNGLVECIGTPPGAMRLRRSVLGTAGTSAGG